MSDIARQKKIVLEIAYEASENWTWLNIDSFGDSEAVLDSDIMVRLSNEFSKLITMEEGEIMEHWETGIKELCEKCKLITKEINDI